jgi:hypothetical protein
MTLAMAYVILIAAGVAASAMVLDAVLRARGVGTRWVWVLSMGLTICVTIFVMIAPPPTAEVAIVRANGAANLIEMRPVETRAASVAAREIAASRMLDTADALLPVLWLVATLALLCALVVGGFDRSNRKRHKLHDLFDCLAKRRRGQVGPSCGDKVKGFGIGRVNRPEPHDDRDARAASEASHGVACMCDRVRVHVGQTHYLDAVQVQSAIGCRRNGLERYHSGAQTTSFELLGNYRRRDIIEIATSPGAQHRAILPADARLDPLRQSIACRSLVPGLGALILPTGVLVFGKSTGVLVFGKIVYERQRPGGNKRAALVGQDATGTIVLEHRERRYRDLLEVRQR